MGAVRCSSGIGQWPPSFPGPYVGVEIALLVFDGAPDALDEDVVAPGALIVHGDGDVGGFQSLDELQGGELTALIRIENFRLAITTQGVFYRLDAEGGGSGWGRNDT